MGSQLLFSFLSSLPPLLRLLLPRFVCCSELVHFKGEPDPFKGDVPNARVREFAKEVLEVLFNANPMATSGPATGSLAAQGRIQGFGSDGPGTCQPPPARSSYSSGYSGGMGVLSSAAASLSEGPLAAGVATVTSAINDFLGNPSARTGLTVRGQASEECVQGHVPRVCGLSWLMQPTSLGHVVVDAVRGGYSIKADQCSRTASSTQYACRIAPA